MYDDTSLVSDMIIVSYTSLVYDIINPLCTDCTTFDPLGSKLFKISIDCHSVIPGLFPNTKICDNTHKKDTLQAHYKHLESFCLHKYTFKPSHQVKYRQGKRNRNSGLNTVRR